MHFMITNLFSIKFFFLLFILLSTNVKAINYPQPQARPEIKKGEYDDVFQQIKKQKIGLWQLLLPTIIKIKTFPPTLNGWI